MPNLERENVLLKKMVYDLATMIKDLMLVMPDDLRTHENSIRALEISQRLIDTYGPSVQAPDNRQQSTGRE